MYAFQHHAAMLLQQYHRILVTWLLKWSSIVKYLKEQLITIVIRCSQYYTRAILFQTYSSLWGRAWSCQRKEWPRLSKSELDRIQSAGTAGLLLSPTWQLHQSNGAAVIVSPSAIGTQFCLLLSHCLLFPLHGHSFRLQGCAQCARIFGTVLVSELCKCSRLQGFVSKICPRNCTLCSVFHSFCFCVAFAVFQLYVAGISAGSEKFARKTLFCVLCFLFCVLFCLYALCVNFPAAMFFKCMLQAQ